MIVDEPSTPIEGPRASARDQRPLGGDHQRVRTWLLNAPRWVLSLITGVPFGGFMAIFEVLQGENWAGALIGGAVSGVIFGFAMGLFTHRMYRRHREAVGAVPADVVRAAGRASWRGPVPEDPEVRAVALRLIDEQLAQARRLRSFTLVALILFIALYIVFALTGSPWWWAAAGFFAALLAIAVAMPGRLQRRAGLLRMER